MTQLSFASDYLEGAHENIIRRLAETNFLQTPGYGTDEICEAAKEKIRAACDAPNAEIFFLVGGTQTNATVIDGFLRNYEGVLAADTGHIALHEAGAIEFGSHKVLTIPAQDGKLTADSVTKYMNTFLRDDSRDHMVQPGMIYISQPTEFGTLYSLAELKALRTVADAYNLPLYVDGARLAYALGSTENDVLLPDLAKYSDAFYIGGTKCGALFGEAVVFPKKGTIPHFFTTVKQHGGLLAKGRLLGIMFDELFTDDLYLTIGVQPVALAQKLQKELSDRGYEMLFRSPTNQVFPILKNEEYQKLSKQVGMSFWETIGEDRTVVRLATSWATTEMQVDELLELF